MENRLTPIMRYTRVYSTAYANLPVVGLREGDLGFATDRLVLYRWSGAAWERLTFHSSSGALADIPAAADLPNGSLYYGTDTGLLYQVQAAAWVTITALEWALLDTETITSGQTTKTLTFAAHDLIKVEYQFIFTNAASATLILRLNAIAAGNGYSTRRIDGNAVTVLAASNEAELLDFLLSMSVVGELLITGRVGAGAGTRKLFTHRGTPCDYDDLMAIDGELAGDNNDLTSITLYVPVGAFDSGGILVYGKNL